MDLNRPLCVALAGLLATVAASAAVAAEEGPSKAGFCDDPRTVASLGPACPADHGWTIRLEDGTILRTHGPDPPGGPGAAGGPVAGSLDANPDPPVCVSGPSTYHNQLLYVHPQDVDSRHDAIADDLRRMVAEINGFLKEEARQEGYVAEYRFLCSGDQVQVDEVTLPHDNADASFWHVVNDLQDKGYDDPTDKYWIFYDDQASAVSAGGTANVYDDDRDALDNRNNQGPSYAVTWGHLAPDTMMHESAHTLGAVQSGSPHFFDNYGGWHCYDEADIMCYGSEARRADQSVGGDVYCPARTAFDCGKDDYFDPSPEPGSYLDTHWNVGSSLNRFLEIRPCSPYANARAATDPVLGGEDPAGSGLPHDAYSCGPPADASAQGDAQGHRVAVSGTGSAVGTVAVSGTGASNGAVAASGTGPADASYVAASGTAPATGGVAVSGAERTEAGDSFCFADTTCYLGGAAAASGTGPSEGGIVAASGTDDAEGTVAASGTGTALGTVAVSGANDCGSKACFDVQAQDDAEAATLAVSGTGESEAGIAVSGTGPARGTATVSGTGSAFSCYTPGDNAWYLGCVAVSGSGESEADILSVSGTDEARGGTAAASGTGDATSECAAVSGTGSSDAPGGFCEAGGRPLEASGCETVADATGSEAACQRVDPDPVLP